jgi:peptide/nickel transport system substrate-binding protein
MTAKNLSLRARRIFRLRRRQIEGLSVQAEKNIDRHFINRLVRLLQVRRFVITWTLLLVLIIGSVIIQTDVLSGYYQSLQPVPGGVYTEGILGDFTTANPLFATGQVDGAVSKLVFASLFIYSQSNQLVGDLASSWSVSPSGTVYTVNLKPNLVWQDGQPLTSKDVVFTYQAIQNPNVQSPLNANWQGVTVAAVNPLTVSFTLSNPLSSFPYSLTNGIIPEHILASVPAAELISANFNTDPVGAGPFSWLSVAEQGLTPQTRQEQINLMPFKHYNGGQPKLSGFIIRAFHDQNQLISSFKQRALNGIAGLENVPTSLVNNQQVQVYSMQLTAANMVFFKTSAGVLADTSVRKAIVYAANINSLIASLGYPANPVREPLLTGQLGFNPAYEQQTDNLSLADTTLTADGWVSPTLGGIRSKAGVPLKFILFAANNPDNQNITSLLKTQLRAAGIDMTVVLQNSVDLSNTITYHNYDALLYGISIGVDPDVFAYWDSSQAYPTALDGVNFSEYKNPTADEGLEAGRIVSDPALRAIKYATFLSAWQSDAPALALYQPRFLYLTNQPVFGLNDNTINSATGHYNNVQNWEIRQARVTDRSS